MVPWLSESLESYRKRLEVSLGKRPPDRIFIRGKILNVFTGELLERDFATFRDRIAYVWEDGPHRVGKTTEQVDLKGKIVVPGYVDSHAHTDLFYTPWEFARAVAARGTTTVFSDSHDMANALGVTGFVKVLKWMKTFPMRFMSGVPLASPPYPVEGEDLYDMENVRRLLRLRPLVRSGSELTPWVKVINQDGMLLKKLHTVRKATGHLEGHTVGARGKKLATLVSAGITSCHEALTVQDVEERLRLGLYVMIRQGSIRREFDALAPFLKAYHPRIMLTPDGLFADEIAQKGYMDAIMKEALEHGADPVSIIRMVTLNPATYFGLDPHLGGIAPGRLADFNILEDLRNPTPVQVWIGGSLVGREGKWVGPDITPPVTSNVERPFGVSGLRAKDFRAHYPDGFATGIPVIDVIDKTVTGMYAWSPAGTGDSVADPSEDILKIALIHREGPQAGLGIGFVHGFGLNPGVQIASSVAHETHHIAVMGSDDGEMAEAVNEVARMGGGVVVRSGGMTVYRLPLPVGGIMSLFPMDRLADELVTIRRILRELGTPLDDPLWTFVFLSFTSILRLRITLSGVYDVREGRVLYNARAGT